MQVIESALNGVLLIKPRLIEDDRGYFFESYNKETLKALRIDNEFIQDNQSKSQYGVIRGLHYQIEPNAQCKLVRVLKGRIYDVAVDLRKGSPSYGKWYGTELSSENILQLYIPKGFAHGFSVLSDTSVVLYKCDDIYTPGAEGGIKFDDAFLNIDWKIPSGKEIISERDKLLPAFENANHNFTIV